ncbi:hypothetical protein L7F22_004619 [Adiantum nelumboides]|nr:hypothetical protein [Adiantum nelumboides]
MEEQLSRSASLRSKGNVFYQQALHGGFGSVAIRGKLARAHQLYNEALITSSNEDDTASCFKNLGMLYWLWCKTELQQVLFLQSSNKPVSPSLLSPCKFYLFKSVRSLLFASKHGNLAHKGEPWIQHIDGVLVSIVDWGMRMSSMLMVAHDPVLLYVCDAFEKASKDPELCTSTFSRGSAKAHLAHANSLFEQGLQKISEDAPLKDYAACLSLLLDCNTSLQRAQGFVGATVDISSDVQALQDSVSVQQSICEAMQALDLGDTLIRKVEKTEPVDVNMVQDSLDHYRQALQRARSVHLECEGMALNRIGKVYTDVLQQAEKGVKYHLQATKLALTLDSSSVLQASWYLESTEKVRIYEQQVADEQKRRREEHIASQQRDYHEKGRRPILQKLFPALSKLKVEAERGVDSFLKFLYTEHPHPDLKRKLNLSSEKIVKDKATLRKAISHYHPDLNIKYGDEWKVLCEEICKILNLKYRA